MKYIYTFILTLIATPSIAGEFRWIEDDLKRCKVWESDERVRWSGSCVNGYAEGYGILDDTCNGKACYHFEGQMKHGMKSGKGKDIRSDGSTYIGDFLNGRAHGIGTIKFANGNLYEGTLKNGTLNGRGVLTWVNGDHYEGDFVDGKRTGKGWIAAASGDRYEGDWIEERRTGNGIYTWARGDRYEGGFVDGKVTGKGVLKFPNGAIRQGTFNDGQQIDGIFIKADGQRITVLNGQEINDSSVPRSAPDSSTSNSFALAAGILGAVAQGAANAGGTKAAQYQLAASALQAASGSTDSQDDDTSLNEGDNSSSYEAPMLNPSDLKGVDLGKNVRFDSPVNECVSLIEMPKSSTYDRPGPGLTNTCSFPLIVYWCADALGTNGANDNTCVKQYNSVYTLLPRERKKIDSIAKIRVLRKIACKKPFTPGGSETIKWENDKFRAPCINSSIYNWDALYRKN